MTPETGPFSAKVKGGGEEVLSQERSQVLKLESELQLSTQKATSASSQAEHLQAKVSELQSSLRKLESDKVLMSRELSSSAQELSQLRR